MPSQDTSSKDIDLLAPEVRRALMLHAPEYFKMTPADREMQRAQWAHAPHSGIWEYLVQHVLSKAPDEIAAIKSGGRRIGIAESTILNTYTQLIHGIGEDFFSWNTLLKKGDTSLSHETVGAHARSMNDYEVKAQGEAHPDLDLEPMRSQIRGDWARYIKQGELRYGSLYSLSEFVGSQLEEEGRRLAQELIPHKFVSGKDNGDVSKGGMTRLDLRVDAGGYEALYDAFFSMQMKVMWDQAQSLRIKSWNDASIDVWEFADSAWGEAWDPGSSTVVFSSDAAMDAVRPKTFLADCAEHAGEMSSLRDIVAREKEDYRKRLLVGFDELKALHPKGSPQTAKKRKVMISPEAMKDISDLRGD